MFACQIAIVIKITFNTYILQLFYSKLMHTTPVLFQINTCTLHLFYSKLTHATPVLFQMNTHILNLFIPN